MRVFAVFAVLFTVFAVLFTVGAIAAEPPKPTAEAVFATRVLPVLKAKCFACHGEDEEKIKGELNLTTRAGIFAGDRPAVVAGKAKDSPLYRAVVRTDADVKAMPPKENDKLTAEQMNAVRDWIDGGAPWPAAAQIAELVAAEQATGVTVKTSGGLSRDWTNRNYKPEDLWGYQPLRPAPSGATVDSFVNAKLRTAGLTPAPPADRRTLIRRATFDLTGLPPTPEEIDQFVNDTSANAYEKLIDRLQASPHYGEQMARHWFDLSRYADSAGFANDYDRGNAWRYRDYVARSFNADKPYDRFVLEQLAGDEIVPADPERLVAVGFLRMGAWELTGMEVAKVARQRFLDDVTDTVGQVFLGHMLQCARCHDHKFDPVPTRDYYRVQAAFGTTQLAERSAGFLPAENIRGFEEKKYLVARQQRLEAELKRIQNAEAAARKRWELANPEKKGEKPPRHEFLSPVDLGLERIARKGLERLKWEFDRYEPVALSVYSGRTPDVKAIYAPFRVPKNPAAGAQETSHILAGGDPFSPQDEVTPGVLSAAGEAVIPTTTDGRRLALAKWIVDPKNPLTARVMANRIWQWTMGAPLAGNPNNFGTTGKKPTHPELLDWLATEFVTRNWSVKTLQKTILMSDAYRRSSRDADPKAAEWYASYRPRRLAAEELRDALLAVSGELNRTVGGIPVRPELNPDVAFQPRQVMGTFAPAWEPSPKPEQRHRRTLYALKLRGVRDPLLDVFNAPVADSPCEARDISTTAPQAFALFNAEATRARALAFATRLLATTKTNDDAIALAFRSAFGRPPTARENDACLMHWDKMTARHTWLKLTKPKRPTEVHREAVEENTGVPFRYTEPLDSAADFVPDPHPADADARTRGLMEVCLVLFNANEFAYLD